MATAPRPGANRDHQAAQAFIRMRVKDATLEMPSPTSMPMKERFAVRAATGFPIEEFVGQSKIGIDSFVVLWWLARRHNGEPALAFDTAAGEFPIDDVDEDDLTFEIVNDDEVADDPEG